MMKICKIIFIIILFFLCINVYSKDRYICNRVDTNEVLNFYITEKKIFLSGLSISGTYSVISSYENGILAINTSKIGEDVGTEIIFLNFNKKIFSIKSSISDKSDNAMVHVKVNCKYIK